MTICQPLSRKSKQAFSRRLSAKSTIQPVSVYASGCQKTYRELFLVGVVVPVVFIGLAIEPEGRIDKIAEKECADAGSDVGYLVDLLFRKIFRDNAQDKE